MMASGGLNRRYKLARFPIVIVFSEEAQAVTIIAVAHARRRPGHSERPGPPEQSERPERKSG